jgi:hypothetical protein
MVEDLPMMVAAAEVDVPAEEETLSAAEERPTTAEEDTLPAAEEPAAEPAVARNDI